MQLELFNKAAQPLSTTTKKCKTCKGAFYADELVRGICKECSKEAAAKVKAEQKKALDRAKKKAKFKGDAPTKPAGRPAVDQGKLSASERMTREEWMTKVTDEHFRPLFKQYGAVIPAKLRVSCGWPSSRAMGAKNRVIGQCWPASASADATTEIFISPALGDAVMVGAVLGHELVHAAVGNKAGHGPEFKKLAVAIGLEGKMTATTPGEAMKKWLAAVVEAVGEYPHAKLDMSHQKKQTTRLLKVVCPNPECEFLEDQDRDEPKPYVVRMSAMVYDAGEPRCGCCNAKMKLDEGKKK